MYFLTYKNMNIDMHFHSTKSDWVTSPTELINIAKQKNLDFITLTDHDIVSDDFSFLAQKEWIASCESCEISVRNLANNKSLHLTFYAREIWEDVKKIVDNTTFSKILLIKKQIELLNKKWFSINYDAFCKSAWNWIRKVEALNKFDLAKYIFLFENNIKHAYQINWWEIWVEDFYLKYLKRNWAWFRDYGYEIGEYEPSLEVCKTIKEKNNWILSIAHPNFTFKNWVKEFENALPHYINNWWINAVEINSKATIEWVEAIIKAKSKYWLYITIWSDNHKLWISDEKHWDFWEKNPYLSKSQIIEYFTEYKDLLLTSQ